VICALQHDFILKIFPDLSASNRHQSRQLCPKIAPFNDLESKIVEIRKVAKI